MSAPPVDVLYWGRERARTGSWRGEAAVAFLNPLPDAPHPSPEFLHRCLATLAERGFTRVVTGALSPPEQAGFLAAGFDVAERLHLLGLDLTQGFPTVPEGPRRQRVRARRRAEVLRVDAAAFPNFWGFDHQALADALAATPHTRFRMLCREGEVLGYGICGRTGARGFVQRLAVDPSHQGQGLGRLLLLDGLHWMVRRGVHSAVVNTQLNNGAALSLYAGVGFREEPVGLSVLSAGL